MIFLIFSQRTLWLSLTRVFWVSGIGLRGVVYRLVTRGNSLAFAGGANWCAGKKKDKVAQAQHVGLQIENQENNIFYFVLMKLVFFTWES